MPWVSRRAVRRALIVLVRGMLDDVRNVASGRRDASLKLRDCVSNTVANVTLAVLGTSVGRCSHQNANELRLLLS